MWAVRSVRLRSDENTTQLGAIAKNRKKLGGLGGKRRRKDEEKTKRRHREDTEKAQKGD